MEITTSNKQNKQQQQHINLNDSCNNFQHHQLVYQCQNQPLSNKSNMPSNTTPKELIVKLDDNYLYSYNLEPATSSISYDNNTSSSRSLINMPTQMSNLISKKESNINNNKNDQESECFKKKNLVIDLTKASKRNKFKQMARNRSRDDSSTSQDESEKMNKNNTNSKRAIQKHVCREKYLNTDLTSQKYSTSYLVQQYFIYLLFCSIIICGSFGFYYTHVSFNLKIEFLERTLNNKIEKRLPVRFDQPKSSKSSVISFFDEEEEIVDDKIEDLNELYKSSSAKVIQKSEKVKNRNRLLEQDWDLNHEGRIFILDKDIENKTLVLYPYFSKENIKISKNCIETLNWCKELLNQENKTNLRDVKNVDKKQDLISTKNVNDQKLSFKTKEFEQNNSDQYDLTLNDIYEENSINPVTKILKSSFNTRTSLKIPSSSSITTTTTISTSTGYVVQNNDDEIFKSTIITNKKKINILNKNINKTARHRKRLEGEVILNKTFKSTPIILKNTTEIEKQISQKYPTPISKCNLKSINPMPVNVLFIGVFHCNWMNNIGSPKYENNYYLTKSYKGSTVTICQNADELKSNRCYRNMPLKYAYYGTGHVIYKNYMFYNQDGTSDLISHNIEKSDTRRISAPLDAQCCNSNNGLYSIKHSGYFDFEIDENGLWLIYKQKQKNQTNDSETYIIAKIEDDKFKELKIQHKWFININKKNNNFANMFIMCGQLYGLRLINNQATIYRLCDLYQDFECKNSSSEEALFNMNVSSRQLTSLSYNTDKKLLYMVDGGVIQYSKLTLS